jgi:hypothetical protein
LLFLVRKSALGLHKIAAAAAAAIDTLGVWVRRHMRKLPLITLVHWRGIHFVLFAFTFLPPDRVLALCIAGSVDSMHCIPWLEYRTKAVAILAVLCGVDLKDKSDTVLACVWEIDESIVSRGPQDINICVVVVVVVVIVAVE